MSRILSLRLIHAMHALTTPFATQIRRVLTHFGTSESLVVNLHS